MVKFRLFFPLLVVGLLLLSGCSTSPDSKASSSSSNANQNQGTSQQTAPTSTAVPKSEAKAPASVDFPTRPIRLVITHPAGSGTDSAARILQPSLDQVFDQPIVIENMVGAGGNLARAHIYKEKPDGYTLLVSQLPSIMIGELLTGGFKALEMTPILRFMGKQTMGLMVKKDSPWQTFEDVVKASKEKPLNLAGPGSGTNGTLAYALFKSAGVNAVYIPFEGGAEVQLALAGGQVDLAVDDTTSLFTSNATDNVRVLAVHSEERNANAPDAPTLLEMGFDDHQFEISIGVFGPPKIPDEILTILGEKFLEAGNDPAFAERAKAASYTASPLGPKDFKQVVESNARVVERFKDVLLESVKK